MEQLSNAERFIGQKANRPDFAQRKRARKKSLRKDDFRVTEETNRERQNQILVRPMPMVGDKR